MFKQQLKWLFVALGLVIVAAFWLYSSQFKALPQASYRLFDQLAAPTLTDRVLVVAPHEDDETLGAGGLIANAVRAGAAVNVIFATDGNKHGLKEVRHQEALKALADVGVPSADVSFYDYPDGKLNQQADFRSRLAADIASFKPTIVVTTLPEDLHPDHAACGQVVEAVWQQTGHSFAPYFFLIHYHRYPRPIGSKSSAYLLPPVSLISANYDWDVLPLSAIDKTSKAQAIGEYHSQLSDKNVILKQLLYSFNRQNELFAFPRQ